jgi:uncharacterized protein YbjT (DUF2867 family)
VLEERGEQVRCLVRRPEALAGRTGSGTEVVAGDVRDADSVRTALEGVDVAYYLVHSMSSAGPFAQADRDAAATFGAAAREAGVRRVIYLGGLGSGRLSTHLASRQEVGRILREATTTTEFRASAVIGSGSASFEIVRALVDRLPVMITPRWVSNRAQPIAVEDQLAYLVAELDRPSEDSDVFEIGGADVVSYGGLMREYGRQRGLRRIYVPVPILTPRLSSLWLGLVTPVYARLGRALIDSIEHDTVVTDPRALEVFEIRPRGYRQAIERALAHEEREAVETRWADEELPERSYGGVRFGSQLADSRSVRVPQAPAAAFAPIRRIGGAGGWYYGGFLWRLRGLLDLLVGGPGLRRGRRDPEQLRVGDAVDFWRVEAYEPDRLLRLRAEMRVPGRAWLQFEVEPAADGGSTIHQTALFDPLGLWGLAYWYAVWPLHGFVFAGMLDGIARAGADERIRP